MKLSKVINNHAEGLLGKVMTDDTQVYECYKEFHSGRKQHLRKFAGSALTSMEKAFPYQGILGSILKGPTSI